MHRLRSIRSFLFPLSIWAAVAVAPRSAAAQQAAAPTAPTAPPTATIPANLTVHAELRHRLEIDGRAKFNPDLSTTEQSLLRSRLGVSIALPKKVTLYLQGQDARIWGEEASTLSGSNPRGDLHQGYVLAEDFMTPGAWLRLGRMELSYGEERLIGTADWTNTGRAFDGVVLGYKGASFAVEAFETKIGEGVGSVTRGRDHDFLGIDATTTALAGNTIEGYAFYDRDADTLATGEERLKRLTIGGRLAGSQGAIGYSAEGAAQTGDAGRSSVSASLVGARVSYEIAHAYHPKVEVGVDRLSGDDNASDDEVKVFDTLFATNHMYYGYMDLFTDIPNDTYGLGLLDIMVKLSVKPSDKFWARLDFHSFKSAEDLKRTADDGTEESLSSFGTELDVLAGFRCTENVVVQGGVTAFVPGDIFKVTRGEENGYWSYLQTRVNY